MRGMRRRRIRALLPLLLLPLVLQLARLRRVAERAAAAAGCGRGVRHRRLAPLAVHLRAPLRSLLLALEPLARLQRATLLTHACVGRLAALLGRQLALALPRLGLG